MATKSDQREDTAFHETLVCHPVKVAYYFAHKRGELMLRANECCDMTGCINLFKKIDPEVNDIQTWSGSELDTRYVLFDGKWRAI